MRPEMRLHDRPRRQELPAVRPRHTDAAGWALGISVALRKRTRREERKHALTVQTATSVRQTGKLKHCWREVDRAAEPAYDPWRIPGNHPHLHVCVEHFVGKRAMRRTDDHPVAFVHVRQVVAKVVEDLAVIAV